MRFGVENKDKEINTVLNFICRNSGKEIEIFDANFKLLHTIYDPWLAGGHTIIPDYNGYLAVSCSASDSVLLINEENYKVEKAFRMPEELYGFNYPLKREDSVVEHYITNDYQLTHINCAFPFDRKIYVSTLIQGAIGYFDYEGNYKELIRGFIGCHGVRVDKGTTEIYFCDSCKGVLLFLNEKCEIIKSYPTKSVWLHDAQQIEENIFAFAVSDRNRVEIIDIDKNKVLSIIPGKPFGKSVQFVYYGE